MGKVFNIDDYRPCIWLDEDCPNCGESTWVRVLDIAQPYFYECDLCGGFLYPEESALEFAKQWLRGTLK